MCVWEIIIYSFISGILTGTGAVITIFFKHIEDKWISTALGFAAGIMIGLSTFSLIPHAIESGSITTVIIGFIAGGLFLWFVDIVIPHIHKLDGGEGEGDRVTRYKKMGYFIAIGIALHNLPEGLSIGASTGVSLNFGIVIAISIGIHNIAEGLSIAVPLSICGVKRSKIIFITVFAGLFTVIGTAIGILIVNISDVVISLSLSFAAGAMIYICSDELIPESHKLHSNMSNMGVMAGFIFSLVISLLE